jgi:hypothetical protein
MLGLLFRLPAVAYFLFSAFCVVGGIGMYFTMQADDADRAAALKHSPPAMVTLDQLNINSYKADYDEIVLQAQLFPEGIIEQTTTKKGREVGRKLFLPLYPLSAKDPSETATAVAVIDGAVTDEQLLAMAIADGSFGPVLQINGLLDRNGASDRGDATNALQRTTKLGQNFAVVKPFIHGRKADLAPRGNGPGIAIFAFVIALLSAGYGFFRRQGESGYEDRESGYQP